MKKIMYVICFAGIVVQSCNHPQPVTDNPFLIPFDTPFEVPPFDKIQNRHYLPAFREGIKEQEAEIQAILKNPEASDTFKRPVAISAGTVIRITSPCLIYKLYFKALAEV